MKQNSIFSYVKRNNNSEGVDVNEQCSSSIKEASNPQRTQCTSTVKIRKWDDTFEIRVLFAKFEEMPEQPSHYNSCFFNFCNNCVFLEVSNNEIFDFLTSNSCF